MTIQEWLSDPADYKTGLALLEAADPDNRFLPSLRKGNSIYNFEKLRIQLREIQGPARKDPERSRLLIEAARNQAKAVHLPRHEIPMGYTKWETVYPEAIAWAIEERGKAVNRRNRLSNQLTEAEDDAGRAHTRALIEQAHEYVRRLSDYIEEWKRNGKVPLAKPHPPMSQGEYEQIQQRMLRCRKVASKAKRKIRYYQDPELDINPLIRQGHIEEQTKKAQEAEAEAAELTAKLKAYKKIHGEPKEVSPDE